MASFQSARLLFIITKPIPRKRQKALIPSNPNPKAYIKTNAGTGRAYIDSIHNKVLRDDYKASAQTAFAALRSPDIYC